MPSISLSLPGASALLPGLTPAAANPIAQIGGGSDAGFASVIAALGQDAPALKPAFSAPLPPAQVEDGPGTSGVTAIPGEDAPALKLALSAPLPPVQAKSETGFALADPTGTDLPSDRPEIAGRPDSLPPLAVEDVMTGGGAAWQPEPVAQTKLETADAAPPPAPATAAQDQPVACGLRDWRMNGASTLALARTIVKPLHAPAPLPRIASDGPEAGQETHVPDPRRDGVSAQPVDVTPPPPSFVPVVWTSQPAPPVAPQDEEQPEGAPRSGSAAASPAPVLAAPAFSNGPVAAVPASVSDPSNDSPNAGPSAAPLPAQPASHNPAPAAAPPPHAFALPPEIARDVARLVQSATGGGTDERAPASEPVIEPAVQPSAPLAAQPAATLHSSFAPSHRPVIDTGRAEWLQNMIERIAEMPQADGRREAQLRLAPDALGPVDVRIEQRDQRLHVTLNAQTPEARQLLSDAAPRLQELAEARGIRFAQTGFGGADAQDRRSQPDHQQPATPLRPRPAAAAADAASDDNGDLIA
jgi:hypothetical protein